MPRGERFYFRHRNKVIDGTKCDDEKLDVCVEGKCMVILLTLFSIITMKIHFYVEKTSNYINKKVKLIIEYYIKYVYTYFQI